MSDRMTFDSPQVAESFRVNEEARTVTGLAVPWGLAARSGFARWKFARSSLKWADVGRVKLLRDHDASQAVGRAVKLEETDAGLLATFKVARGEAGDRVLALAADGVLDGLSVGIDFSDDAGWRPDPTDDSVRLVTSALLREVSLCALPAFDDARVSGVKASRTTTRQEITVPDENTGGTATAPDLAAVSEAIVNGFSTALERFAQPAGREVVPAGRALTVREEPLYRFDGTRGQYDLSTDLRDSLLRQDTNARQRLAQWGATFDVDTTDAAGLAPTSRQRDDLYVDQRDYRYPVWDSIRKGSLEDNTPLVLPKYASSSGLVTAHTEGVEPTPGAMAWSSQTITPSALSGKLELTRELIDRASPQLSVLIRRQIDKAYYEGLEAAAVAMLDAASPTQITLTTAATGATLVNQLTSNLAALQYIRGGFAFSDLFLQIDLFKALEAASDSTGRKLLPFMGPQNAPGDVSARWASFDIGGVRAVPAWALAATGTVAASSYLIDRESVVGFATPPRQLRFEYRVAYVDIGVWGYRAMAVTDLTGVRELVYDPA